LKTLICARWGVSGSLLPETRFMQD